MNSLLLPKIAFENFKKSQSIQLSEMNNWLINRLLLDPKNHAFYTGNASFFLSNIRKFFDNHA